MSKQPLPPQGGFDEELPPPYTERANDNSFSSHLSHLQNSLPAQSSADDDSGILATLVDPIDNFITQVSNLKPTPKTVEGTFIPEEALSPEWTLSDEGEKHKGELTKAIRVKTKSKEDTKISKEGSSWRTEEPLDSTNEFDDWGRWDEPSSNASTEDALWWTDESLALHLAKSIQPTSLRGMHVRAEHVTFRRENEMGIWESKSGWGIVVRLRL